MCQINVHAGLFGTFCNFKRERQNDLFPFEKQNVPNKPACTFIWHIRVGKLLVHLHVFVQGFSNLTCVRTLIRILIFNFYSLSDTIIMCKKSLNFQVSMKLYFTSVIIINSKHIIEGKVVLSFSLS